mgnify:FL=1
MKTNGVPAMIMLAAGFIDCVIAILTHMSLWDFTRQLLLVLVLFYVIGCVVKMIIDRNFKEIEEEQNGQEPEDSKQEQKSEESDQEKTDQTETNQTTEETEEQTEEQ